MIKSKLTVIACALLFQTGAMAQIHVKTPGNVGVGVPNPDFKLQVNGHTEVGDQNAHDPTKYGTLQLIRPANPGDEKFHLSFVRAANAITGIGYAGNSNNFGIWVSPSQGTIGTPTIGFTPGGNVGIGTSAPADKLHVMGNLRLSAGNEIYFADNGQIRSLDDNHRILFRRAEDRMELREYGNILFSAGATAGAETATMVVANNQNVGIGTTSPGTKLDVNGTITAGNAGGGYHLIINDINTARWALGTGGHGFHIANDYTSAWTDQFYIDPYGNVGIGTTSPGYKLQVEGDVKANTFHAAYNSYADYVFDSTYQLPSLREVAAYIKENHHLPEVPSEAEVKRDGLNLSSHQVILLKKIEELTLYAIEQNEKQKLMEEKLNEVLNANNKLKEEIEELKKKAKAVVR